MSFAYTISGGYPPYTASIVSGALPPGVTLSTAGVLSGVATTPGDYVWRVQVADVLAQTAFIDDASSITVAPALFLTGDAPGGNVGTAYTYAYAASGGVPPYAFSIDDGALPPGLVLSSGGVLSGVPTTLGAYAWRVKLVDSIGQIVHDDDTADVKAHASIVGDAPDAELTVAYSYAYTLASSFLPVTAAITAGALPTGLSLSSAGVITGTTTATGDFSWTVTATDADGATASLADTAHSYAKVLIAGSAPDGTTGTAYTYAYAASLGKPPYVFDKSIGTLPPGLTLASNGLLSGTPTTDGTYTWTVRVTDSLGGVATVADSVNVITDTSVLSITPFTYDEADHSGILAFTRQGQGPHQTPAGFEGNGYDSRYKATALPSWLTGASSPFGMQCSYQGFNQFLANENCNGGPTPKEDFSHLFYLGPDSAGATAKCAIGLQADNGKGSRTCVAARMNGATFTFNRPNWHFQSLTPEYQQGGRTWVPNALIFKDATHLWSCAHLEDTVSRVWETNPDTGVLIRSFDYPSPYTHVANFARRPSTGDIWFTDSPTSKMGIVDMEASFTAGAAVLPTIMDTTSFNKIGAIDFVTISGTEYFVAAEYATGGTPYLYVFLASKVGAVTLTAADRVKRWPVRTSIQGLVMKGTQCYISSNENQGIVSVYDLASMLSSLADGDTPTTIWQEDAATSYPEDICLHPTTGEFWMPIEGNATVMSDRAHLSFWSSPLNGTCQPSSYTINYDGTNVHLLHNGKDYFTYALTPVAAACVSIGGPPATGAGRTNGYMYGFVKNVALSDTPITTALAANIASGSYETRVMTAIQIALVNPGAESGITGWTVESGTLSQIANTGSIGNLWARTGTNAFGSVASAGVVASQRVDLTGRGLTTAQLDSGAFWLKPRWWSTSLDVSENRDPGGDGIRLLNASSAQISEVYSPQFAGQSSLPGAHYPWNPRSMPVAITSGSRKADLLMKGTRSTDDGSTQCFFDDHDLWIFGPALT